MAQTVGVSAVFDTKQFNAGLQTYVNGMNIAQNVTVNVTKDVNGLNSAFSAGLGRQSARLRLARSTLSGSLYETWETKL